MRFRKQANDKATQAKLKAIRDLMTTGKPIKGPRSPQGMWIQNTDGTLSQGERRLTEAEFNALLEDDEDDQIIAMRIVSESVIILPAKVYPTMTAAQVAPTRQELEVLGIALPEKQEPAPVMNQEQLDLPEKRKWWKPKKVQALEAVEHVAPVVAAKKDPCFDIDAFMENAIDGDEIGRFNYEIGRRMTRPIRMIY